MSKLGVTIKQFKALKYNQTVWLAFMYHDHAPALHRCSVTVTANERMGYWEVELHDPAAAFPQTVNLVRFGAPNETICLSEKAGAQVAYELCNERTKQLLKAVAAVQTLAGTFIEIFEPGAAADNKALKAALKKEHARKKKSRAGDVSDA